MSYVQSLLLLICISVFIFSKSSHIDAPLIHAIRGRTATTLRVFESPPNSPPPLKPLHTTGDGAGDNGNEGEEEGITPPNEDGDLSVGAGGKGKFRPRLLPSYSSISLPPEMEEGVEGGLESPGFEFVRDEERAEVSMSLELRPERGPMSSPATPTGTRGRIVQELASHGPADEEGWQVFGPNARVAELRAKGKWQQRSPLGSVAADANGDGGGEDGGWGEEEEREREQRLVETARMGVGAQGIGGLRSPPESRRGSRSSPGEAEEGQAVGGGWGGGGGGGKSKGHSRQGSKNQKKKRRR